MLVKECPSIAHLEVKLAECYYWLDRPMDAYLLFIKIRNYVPVERRYLSMVEGMDIFASLLLDIDHTDELQTLSENV